MLSNAKYTVARTEDAAGAEMFYGWWGPMNVVHCEIYCGSRGGAEGAEMFYGWWGPMNVVQCEIYCGSHRGRGAGEMFFGWWG